MGKIEKVENKRIKELYMKIQNKEGEEVQNVLNEGVSEEALKETEDRIGVILPSDYREFLLHTNGGSLFNHTIDLTEVHDKSKGGRKEGVGYLDKEIFTRGNEYGVPEGYLVISDTGYGDLVCLDTMSSKGRVAYWNHETKSVEQEWETFLDWLDEVVESSDSFV